ncbi:hypothetical protein A1O3_03160 [Capronia epimyces CBS 606.96]|uniref:Uncharacterized protein n=1 Tax=Capronia epimyces CBS 606.96 TaxID=1182542 RepID=W9YLG4_9EURO|nr:uncharacterized protein A1O3_03160 [Capronia epimyces CBS 606.96]EXJ90091.1 hypothetical protein A1O3_03160 [Capronia epimyces CBS 606.96]
MAFCFVMGTNDFTGPLKGYESITAQCHNCGNWSAHPISSWEWFTFCFIPVIPLGSKHKDVGPLLQRVVLVHAETSRSLLAQSAGFAKIYGIDRMSSRNKAKGQLYPHSNKDRR